MSNIDIFFEKNCYTDAVEKDRDLLDIWTSDFKYCKIHYIQSHKSDIFTLNDVSGEMYHIVWDVSFWDLFLEYLYIIDETNFSTELDVNTLIENSGYSLALFLNYLSKRYSYYTELATRLSQNANIYGYNILAGNLYGNLHEKESYSFPIAMCKQFVFWHEFSHIEFKKFDKDTSLYQKHIDLIYSILDEASNNDIIFKAPEFTGIIPKIKTRTIPQNLIEELAVDLRAFQRLFQYGEVYSNKKRFAGTIVQSVTAVIDFIMTKSITDKRWDYYVFHKNGELSDLTETHLIRKILFPVIVYIKLGYQELGNSFLYDINMRRDNAELFMRTVDIIEREWFIKNILSLNPYGDFINVYAACRNSPVLNVISNHISCINVDNSTKRLKYLFNLAHTAQHSNNPLDCIPLFHEFIEKALEKNNENKRNIGDAYSRIARVYAEN